MFADIARVQASVATKSNTHRIESSNVKTCYKNMSTGRIVWTSTSFLAYRHRVGLLIFANVAFIAYLAWDKIIYLFV